MKFIFYILISNLCSSLVFCLSSRIWVLYKRFYLELKALLLQNALAFFFFFLWNANSLIIFKFLSVFLMGGFGLWESLPERGKSVVCKDVLEKVVCQKSFKDPWGMERSLMARHGLEKFWCSFKVLWGAKWPWNSLDIRNYMYDWQVYFLPSPPAVPSAADALFQVKWRTDFTKLKVIALFLFIFSG